MPSFFPEGNTALVGDDERRLLIKWNSIAWNASPVALSFFPEGSQPLASDDERRSLIKINNIISNGADLPGPEDFLPEAGTAKASDSTQRSLQKISSLLGATALAGDSDLKSLQRIVLLVSSGSNPTFLPEGGVGKTSDNEQRSLWKIVANYTPPGVVAGAPTLQVTDLAAAQGANSIILTWTPSGEGDETVIMWSDDGGATFTELAVISSALGTYTHTDVLLTEDIEDLRYYIFTRNGIGDGPVSNIATPPPPGAIGPGPLILAGVATFQADDLTWHLVDLSEEDDGQGSVINTPQVDQGAVADPGAPYIGYAVMLADDATRHKMSLILDGGIYSLFVEQAETVEDLSGDVTLASPSGLFDVTVILDAGIYTWKVAQP